MPATPRLAKLSRPRPRNVVPRGRLFTQLDAGAGHPLIWIAAPPGAGKTTLVSSYLELRKRPVAWYQVDAGDADPATFFHYLGLAAQGLRGRAVTLPQFMPEHAADLPSFARLYARALFSALGDGAVLVLDNFQDAVGAVLADILHAATPEVPDGCTVLVISRAAPTAAFADLAAREAMVVVRWEHLRLTLEETRAIAAARGTTEDWVVEALHQRADGWAAGVTLMLERLRRAGTGVGTLDADACESAFDYFATLVFEQAPASTKQTLLSVAFAPQVTASVAQRLSGNEDAGRLLEALHRRNLFTDRRPGGEPVYQFHALFQAFLQARAMETLGADSLRTLLTVTGSILDDAGEWEQARDVYVRAEQWDGVTAIVRARAGELLDAGRRQTLEAWIRAIPETIRNGDGWLLYWLARAIAQVRPPDAVAIFECAYSAFLASGDDSGRALSAAGIIEACGVDHFDYHTVDRWLDTLAELLISPRQPLPPENELVGWGAFVSAATFVRPWHAEIERGHDRIEALSKSVVSGRSALSSISNGLNTLSIVCRMDRLAGLRPTVLRLARDPQAAPAAAGWSLFVLAHHEFLLGRYEESLALFDEIWSLAERHGMRQTLRASMMHRFAVEFRLLDPEDVPIALSRIEALPPSGGAMGEVLIDCYRARAAGLQGRLNLAADLAERADAKVMHAGAAIHELVFGLIHGEILLAAGRVDRARQLVQRSRTTIERIRLFDCYLPSLLLVEAWLADSEERFDDRDRLLRDALHSSPMNYRWCQIRFVDTTAARMLRVALARGIEVAEARRLIRVFRLRPVVSDGEAWPWPVKVFCLGRFEVRVDDRPLDFGHKAPKKALALLKALVAFGPREVPEQRIADALWPDDEGDAGHKALSVTLLRLRRILEDHEVVRLRGGLLSIDRSRCWVDAWQFEEQLTSLVQATDASADGGRDREVSAVASRYLGVFLPNDADEVWTTGVRERLRAKFIHAVGILGSRLEEAQRHEEAIEWYQRGLDADELVETFYQGLLRCYARLDRRVEGIGVYIRLRKLLSATLGIRPSAATERLHEALRSD